MQFKENKITFESLDSKISKENQIDNFLAKYKEARDLSYTRSDKDLTQSIGSLNEEVGEMEKKLDTDFIISAQSLPEIKENIKLLVDKTKFNKYQRLLDFANGLSFRTLQNEILDERVNGVPHDTLILAKEKIAGLLGFDYKKEILIALENKYDEMVKQDLKLIRGFTEAGDHYRRVEGNGPDSVVKEAKAAWDKAENDLHAYERSMLPVFNRMPDKLKEKYRISTTRK